MFRSSSTVVSFFAVSAFVVACTGYAGDDDQGTSLDPLSASSNVPQPSAGGDPTLPEPSTGGLPDPSTGSVKKPRVSSATPTASTSGGPVIDPAPCTAAQCGGNPFGAALTKCPDGSLHGPVCGRENNTAGTCGWHLYECPPVATSACTAAECGPRPASASPDYICPDGSTAGLVCIRTAATSCGWVMKDCK